MLCSPLLQLRLHMALDAAKGGNLLKRFLGNLVWRLR